MKKPPFKRPVPPRSAGFTLVEVLMVVMIIALLVGMVVGISGYVNKKAAIGKAQATLGILTLGLEEYRARNGFYPPYGDSLHAVESHNGMRQLMDDLYYTPVSQSRKPYVELNDSLITNDHIPKDPWGMPYWYSASTNPNYKKMRHNPDSYDLFSFGPDGRTSRSGGGRWFYPELEADDIKNW